jgi:hypothetical protein
MEKEVSYSLYGIEKSTPGQAAERSLRFIARRFCCFEKLAGEHWFQFLPLDDGTKTRFVQGECFTGLGVGLFKLMVSVENTRKGFIAMNEALKKEAEAKVTEKLV